MLVVERAAVEANRLLLLAGGRQDLRQDEDRLGPDFRQDLSGYDTEDWCKLVALTLGAQLLGHSLFNVVLRSISPTVLSLTILLEIPGAALIAAVFLDQTPPLLAVPAAALLIAGLALVIRASRTEAVPVE